MGSHVKTLNVCRNCGGEAICLFEDVLPGTVMFAHSIQIYNDASYDYHVLRTKFFICLECHQNGRE